MEFINACSVEIGMNKVLIFVYLVNYDIVVCIYACCTYVYTLHFLRPAYNSSSTYSCIIQILMSVQWALTCVMIEQCVQTPMVVTSVPATWDSREMDSLALVSTGVSMSINAYRCT